MYVRQVLRLSEGRASLMSLLGLWSRPQLDYNAIYRKSNYLNTYYCASDTIVRLLKYLLTGFLVYCSNVSTKEPAGLDNVT